jgi:hypothetical protein
MEGGKRELWVLAPAAVLVVVACGRTDVGLGPGAGGATSADAETGGAGAATPTGGAGGLGAAITDASSGGDSVPTEVPDGGPPLLPSPSLPPPPTYDGGIVNVVNSTSWSETIYPPDKRRMLLRDQGVPHVHLLDLGNAANNWSQVAGGPWARGLQLIGNNQVLGGRNDGYEVFDLTTGAIVKTVTDFGNTQSAYRMANGETMLTRSGTVLTFLDNKDRAAHQISYPGHGFVRLARPTRNGTFLIPNDQTLFEGDAQGNELWSLTAGAPDWGHIWEALLMSDGNVLVSTFYGASLDVVDKTTHTVTRRYGTRQMPDAATLKPNVFADVQILPNGNLITANWQGAGAGNGTMGIQVIEFDPSGAVAWFYKQDPNIFSSIQGVMVIDGLDPQYLHVQEISPGSTWQPVIPTP